MATDNLAIEPVNNSTEVDANLSNETTVDADVTQEGIQEPTQDEVTLEKPADKAEELEGDDEVKESQFVEIDGKEIDLDDIKKWRDGHLMQSDYTKKTTEHAEFAKKERAGFVLERENLSKSKAEVSEMQDTLAVLVAEDEAIDWIELKDEDPERYIELKEKADKRKEALEKVKAERATPIDDPVMVAEEQQKFSSSNIDWFDKEGKATDTYIADMKLLQDFAVREGFTADEFKSMTKSHFMTTIMKAARYDQLQDKGRKIKEKRVKVPVVTKPKAAKANAQPKTAGQIFFPNV